jgi:pimeloyl-ACP methyl ester carboxylesterase
MAINIVNEFYKTHPVKKLQINDKEWEYISCGRGKETILLLPGGAQTAQGNFRLIQSFEDTYRVIVPNIYAVDSISEFCLAINTILEKENVSNIIVYGLSIGGMMGLSYTKRNKEKVTKLILSHSCAPDAKKYTSRIKPLLKLHFLLVFVPSGFITFFGKHFIGRLQGESNEEKTMLITHQDNDISQLNTFFNIEFFEKYLTKRLITTWVYLHRDFLKEKITVKDFSNWQGNVLILTSDNDPLVQDEGELKSIFPKSREYMFHNTGHLTYYYQFPQMIEVMKDFLK